MSQQTVLVTGGLGFIGSHTSVELLQRGYQVVIVDNLCNADPAVATKMTQLLTPEQATKMHVYHDDLCDLDAIRAIFSKHRIDAIINFASLKAVGESVSKSLLYYRNNLTIMMNLLELMAEFKVHQIIQSSSATVYGNSKLPYKESEAVLSRASCPYGQTKINIEYMLEDASVAMPIQAICLRYFNPVGAHPTGIIGEELTAVNNIFPYLSSVYLGRNSQLTVFGGDYPTSDGTCERDYIHVMDLVDGHIKALEFLATHPEVKFECINLGSGTALSVLEICKAFNQYADRPVPYVMGERRAGDLPQLYADPTKAWELLGFKTTRGLQQMIEDTLRFLQQLPPEQQ